MTGKIGLLHLFLLVYLPSFHLSAQAWNPFPHGNTFGYSATLAGQANEHLFGVRMDSIRLEGNDSAHYFYRIDRPAGLNEVFYACNGQLMPPNQFFRTNQDHFFGKKMLCSSNGDCRFIFSDPDTFLLRTLAQAGDTWAFHPFLVATVDSVVLGTALGVVDSLKYISVNNGRKLVLSRSHGLVSMFNLHEFNLFAQTNINVDFRLWGIHEMGLGGRLPGIREIFGYQPSDILGYEYGYAGTSFHSSYGRNIYTITSLDSLNPLTYTASLEQDFSEWGSSVQNGWNHTYTAPHSVRLVYWPSLYSHVDLLPYEHNKALDSLDPKMITSVEIPSSNPSQIEKNYAFAPTRLIGWYSPCAQLFGLFGSNVKYALGQGEIDSRFDRDLGYDYSRLLCYNTVGDTSPPCGPLLVPTATADPNENVDPHLTAFPIPAAQQITFKISGNFRDAASTLFVYDASGRLMDSVANLADNQEHVLEVHLWPAGIYLARLEGKMGLSTTKRFVVAH